MTHLSPNELLGKALQYAERGVAVFATTRDGKAPSISNAAWSKYLGREVQKGEGGLHQASTDPENLRWQFSRRNSGGIGMPCGKVNGVIVADFDIHKEEPGGNAHQRMLQFEDEIEATHRVRTRNGGLHAYFAYAPGHQKFELGENIEIQSDGAYVLLPPSKGYRVENSVFREDWDVPPWPPTGFQTPEGKRRELSAETPPEILAMARAIRENNGRWHDAMVPLVAHLYGAGWSDAEILKFVPQWTASGFTHAQTFEEVCTAIQGARNKWKREERTVKSVNDNARIDAFAGLWNRASPEARRIIADMVREADQ